MPCADLSELSLAIMARGRSLLLLALAAFAAGTSAQNVQSGLLYWCSTIEGGANMAAINAANQPRTYWQGVNVAPGFYADVCHFGNRQTDNVMYTFNNGTAYPANIPTSNYAVAPSTCQVRGRSVYARVTCVDLGPSAAHGRMALSSALHGHTAAFGMQPASTEKGSRS